MPAGRVPGLPPLESLGEQQPLRESLVILSGQGPCEQKPSLANCRFHTLAPGFLEGFSVRHLSVCAVNAVVADDPQKELVVRRPELPIVSVTRAPRHAPVQKTSMASAFSNRALSLNGAFGLSKSSVENFLKHSPSDFGAAVDIWCDVGVFGNETAQVYELVDLVVRLAGCCNL